MNYIIALVIVVLGIQIALFFMIRAQKKRFKKDNVIDKYNIRSPGEAWNLMNDPDIPEEDRLKIEKIYRGDDS